MILTCQYSGGLEVVVITCAMAAIVAYVMALCGHVCWLLARMLRWLRKDKEIVVTFTKRKKQP